MFFVLGIVCAGCFRIACAFLFLPTAAGCISAWLFCRIKFLGTACLWASIFCLGMLCMRHDSVLPRNHIVRIKRYVPSQVYQVTGYIRDSPEFKDGRTRFTLKTEEIAGKHLRWKCCGDILVTVKGTMEAASGQRLSLEGTLSRAFGRYYRGRKIFLALRVKSAHCVTETGSAKGPMIRQTIARLKHAIEQVLTARLSRISAGVLSAMILGEQSQVPQVIYRAMMKTGTVHILVVSGFNVGIVCFIFVLLLKMLRIPRRPRFFCCAFLLTGYCLLTGASTPVLRATIMALVFLFAYFVKRQEDIYNAFCLAVMVILGVCPRNIFDIGFQLSFASVLSIAFLYPRLKNLVRLDVWRSKAAKLVFEGVLVSFAAWLGTAGLIFYHFRIVSPVTVLANLFIVPLATLLTLSGLSLIGAEYLSPYFALTFVPTIEFFVSLLLRINSFLVELPWAFFRLPQ